MCVVVRVALVLGLKGEALVHWAEEHFRDLDPIADERRREERLELIAATVRGWALVELGWHALEQADGDIPALEGERLAEETACSVDTLRV